MRIPRYWAKADGSAVDPSGKAWAIWRWGWSQESVADALAVARRRLADSVARIARGETIRAYLYGTAPLREEILRSLGEAGTASEAVVTRNRYGALVLNTARVPFIDVDAPPVGLGARLARFFRRDDRDADPTLARLRAVCASKGSHAFRIYRTPNGYRVLAANLALDPSADSTGALLAEFAADPYFIKLCKLQGSFRARLTPKPWRCGCPLPPNQHPRDDREARERFEAWRRRYEAESARFASCRYLESIGGDRPSANARAIVEEHDRVSRALADLPLA
jgi:hypothetical protein